MNFVVDTHLSEYKCEPELIAVAPGRVHLIGEHSWFFKDKTLSMAINIPVYVAISKRSDSTVKFYFRQYDERKRANLSSLKFKKEDRWANDVKSVIYGFLANGFVLPGMNITVYSDILPSAGFGITTAIKAATAVALQKILACDDGQMLRSIERGSRNFLHINYYRADFFASLYAKKNNLIVTDYSKNSYELIPFPFEGKKVLLTDTRVPRVSGWNEESMHEPENALLLGELREEKNGVIGGWQYINDVTEVNEVLSVVSSDTRRKLQCIIREHGDVLDACDALSKNDFGKFSRAVNHSHESMRELFDLSCPEIEWILKRVSEIEPNLEHLRNPVSCGRITGKGFGRCVYTVIRDSDVAVFNKKLEEYEKFFCFHPSSYDIIPSDGAHIVSN